MESRPVHLKVPGKIRHSIYKLKMHVLPHGQQARSFSVSLSGSSADSAVI